MQTFRTRRQTVEDGVISEVLVDWKKFTARSRRFWASLPLRVNLAMTGMETARDLFQVRAASYQMDSHDARDLPFGSDHLVA